MKKNTFSMLDENGNEVVYDVLFTFESEETGKNYIVYTDNQKDETGNIEVYASIYYPNDPQSKLEAIETEKEWKVLIRPESGKLLKQYLKLYKKKLEIK